MKNGSTGWPVTQSGLWYCSRESETNAGTWPAASGLQKICAQSEDNRRMKHGDTENKTKHRFAEM